MSERNLITSTFCPRSGIIQLFLSLIQNYLILLWYGSTSEVRHGSETINDNTIERLRRPLWCVRTWPYLSKVRTFSIKKRSYSRVWFIENRRLWFRTVTGIGTVRFWWYGSGINANKENNNRIPVVRIWTLKNTGNPYSTSSCWIAPCRVAGLCNLCVFAFFFADPDPAVLLNANPDPA